jgi:tetratricopeptide (TPR) repeat protein
MASAAVSRRRPVRVLRSELASARLGHRLKPAHDRITEPFASAIQTRERSVIRGAVALAALLAAAAILGTCVPAASAASSLDSVALGRAYANRHLPTQAALAYLAALQINSSRPDARAGLHDAVAAISKAQAFFAAGRKAAATGDPSAVGDYVNALKSDAANAQSADALSALLRDTPLKLAKKFTKLGLLDRARDAYRAALKRPGQRAAARKGLRSVARREAQAEKKVTLGNIYKASQDVAAAASSYLAALKVDRSNTHALSALAALPGASPSSPSPFAVASALARAGYDKAAADEVQRVLKSSPQAVPAGLTYLSNTSPSWWTSFRHFVDPLLRVLLDLILVAAFVLVIYLVIDNFIRARQKRLIIQSFDGGADKSSLGATVAAIVQERLAQMGGAEQHTRLHLISTAPEQVSIASELAALAKPVGLLTGLLEHLAKPKVYSLSGTLLPAGERGVGMTLLLRSPTSELVGSVTLWQYTYDPAAAEAHDKPSASTNGSPSAKDPYDRVAAAAASWLLLVWRYQIKPNRKPVLGTTNWESLALFQCGALEEGQDSPQNRVRAKTLFARALGADPGNRGALLNLGVLESWDGNYGRARVLLKELETALQTSTEDADETDLLRLRMLYARAALEMNLKLCSSQHDQCRESCSMKDQFPALAADDPRPHAEALLRRCAVVLQSHGEDAGSALAELARKAQSSALLLLAQMLRDNDPVPVKPVGASNLEAAEGGGAWNGASLRRLIEQEPGAATQVASYDQYALACYFAQRAQQAADGGAAGYRVAARENLRSALESGSPSLRVWASKDPSLCPLRQGDPEVAALLRQRDGNQERPAHGLGILPLIGHYAVALAKQRISDEDELRKATADVDRRKDLAKKLEVSIDLVNRWAEAAKLMEINGIGPSRAALLDTAGVRSVGALARKNPEKLFRLLQSAKGVLGLEQAPGQNEVQAWIEEAKQKPRSGQRHREAAQV